MIEFTDEQVRRIDEIQNAVFDLCKVMTNDENLQWDISFIGDISDIAADILTNSGHRVYYPFRVTFKNGTQKIFDYHDEN